MELYVHIPFCRSKCRYCDFPSRPGCEDRIGAYIDAVIKEAEMRGRELSAPVIETVFIGGGTPSILPAEELSRLLAGLRRVFRIAKGAEFTSEVNPGTLTESWLSAAADGGVNRISMGMQAMQPHLLRTLGRTHDWEAVCRSADIVRAAGIRNMNLDLMFGLPGQTADDWRESLLAALSLHPEHLSCYSLIPEDGTPLKSDLDAGRLALPEEETERIMYDDAIRITAEYGMRQYEISNFALPGRECRHNIGYWHMDRWLGIGASAASLLDDPQGKCAYVRETDPADLDAYLAMIAAGRDDRTRESVSVRDAGFELVMMGLRMTEGVRDDMFLTKTGSTIADRFGGRAVQLADAGLLAHENGAWRLTRRGLDVQNAVLLELMDD